MTDGTVYELSTMSGFAFTDRDRSCRITRRKAQALLTYLWLQPNHTESRSRLANLLWSRSNEADARVSLRQELSRLNRELAVFCGMDILGGDKFSIWLARKPEPCDAEAIVAALNKSDVAPKLTESPLLQEQYLAHLEGIDPELDLWISVQRTTFTRRCTKALEAVALDAGNRHQTREAAARALLNLDPSDENACRMLMSSLAERGDTTGALTLFEELSQLLRREYDVEPGTALTEFAQSLRGDRSPSPSRQRDRPGSTAQELVSERILLLVHPAETMQDESSAQRRFSVLRSELIGALSRFRDWSVREYSGDEIIPAANPAKVYELKLSGEAGVDGDFFTINLIAADTRAYVWSESLEIDYSRVAGQRRDSIRKLASALNVEISAHRMSQIVGSEEADLDIYDRWLVGERRLLSWRPEDEAKAEGIFRSILAQSGTFAPAISGLVQILNTRHHIFPGMMRSRERETEALELARRASRMAPHDSRTQLTLAWCYLMNSEYDQAIYYFQLALDINDNDPWTLVSAAQGLCYAGAKAQAIELALRANATGRGGTPMHWAYMACIHFHVADYATALDALARAEGAAYFVGGMRVATLGQLDDCVAANRAAEKFETDVRKAWSARKKPTQMAIREWFLQLFPIRMQADLERLETGLDKAGFGV
ncbi:BTAD domain-containing putative transcriptional regulator [Roseibium sp.]|uniref:BTAD domain-containing putative transcriptional regulator n=1 Tax=Roseibium sp. TaxID=1936156 RepID=UPI003A96FE41